MNDQITNLANKFLNPSIGKTRLLLENTSSIGDLSLVLADSEKIFLGVNDEYFSLAESDELLRKIVLKRLLENQFKVL